MSELHIGCSPLTNTIYAGKAKESGNGVMRFIGNKTDVTEEVLVAAVEFFIGKFESDKSLESIDYKVGNKKVVIKMENIK